MSRAKNWILASVALFLAGTSGMASAGQVANAAIVHLTTIQQDGNLLFINVNQASTNPPACSTNPGFQFVLALNTTLGQQTMAMLLAARASGALVTIVGSGDCGVFATIETAVNVAY